MARYRYPPDGNGFTHDQNGRVLDEVTVSVFLASLSTPASIYAAASGGTAVNSVISDSSGKFVFYIDGGDYSSTQQFDIAYTKDNFETITVSGIAIISESVLATPATSVSGNIVTWDDTTGSKIEDSGVAVTEIATLASDVSTLSSTKQNLNANLTALAGLTGAANKIPMFTGPGAMSLGSITTVNMVDNLKPVVNANVSKLDIFTKSGGAEPDINNAITIAIPDGNGYTFRSRSDTYLSGTGQIIMADGANYWSKGSLDGEIKTAWLHYIWDGVGLIPALAGYAGFSVVPTTTTVTDDDYFLLESGSSYTRNASHYCVAVAKIRFQYDTADTPDHTIQASGENAPQVFWNPKSDYGYTKNLTTTVIQGGTLDAGIISVVVKQSGSYLISSHLMGSLASTPGTVRGFIATGNATYSSATQKSTGKGSSYQADAGAYDSSVAMTVKTYLNSGDTIHLGAYIYTGIGNTLVYGDNALVGATQLTFSRAD